MLIDKLRMRISPQQDAEVIEPGNYALQLYPFTRKTVTGVLFFRTWFRNTSCTFCDFSLDMGSLP